jgi:hypothetical protein
MSLLSQFAGDPDFADHILFAYEEDAKQILAAKLP